MIVEIPKILSAQALEKVNKLFDKAPKRDGKLSAQGGAVNIKENVEVEIGSVEYTKMCALINQALTNNPMLRHMVMPVAIADPIFAAYNKGFKYGEHVDSATALNRSLPNQVFGGYFRADVSATLFLSEPEDYQGGELTISTPLDKRRIKCAAGNMITYPSGYVHSVEEVSAGTRRVSAMWFQSYIRNATKREIIFRMFKSSENLSRRFPNDEDSQEVNNLYHDLMRMWGGK